MAEYKEGQRLVLLDLPDEVLVHIIKYLPPPHTLEGFLEEEAHGNAVRPFRATCRKAYRLSDFLWWRCLSVHTLGQYRRIKEFLGRDPLRPHHVQHLELMPEYRDIRESTPVQEMAALASLCPNLERLSIWPKAYLNVSDDLLRGWETSLASQFQSTNFNKLQFCYARFWFFEPRVKHPLILPLLSAPRLIDLTLEGADLVGLRLDSIPIRSTALKELKLYRCRIDEPTLAAILAAPRSLASFQLSTPFTPHNWVFGEAENIEEYSFILQVIKLLTRLQPKLLSLVLAFQNGAGFEEEDILPDRFDLSGLSHLKELTLNALSTYFLRPMMRRMVDPVLWRPIYGLYYLPASLERLNLFSETEDIDLGALADALLRLQCSGRVVPSPLRLSCEVQKEHQRPLNSNAQADEERNLRAIEIFMTQLSFLEIKYTKRWFAHLDDPFTENIYSCTRALEARRSANADIVDDSGPGSRSFELKDEQYSEREFIEVSLKRLA